MVKRDKEIKNGASRSCRWCCLVTVEEGCQEGAQSREIQEQFLAKQKGRLRRFQETNEELSKHVSMLGFSRLFFAFRELDAEK